MPGIAVYAFTVDLHKGAADIVVLNINAGFYESDLVHFRQETEIGEGSCLFSGIKGIARKINTHERSSLSSVDRQRRHS